MTLEIEDIKHYGNALPEGIYTITIVDAEQRVSQHTSMPFWVLSASWEGTDRAEWIYLSDHERAAWRLAQFGIDSIEDIYDLIGRTFKVQIRQEIFNGEKRNKVAEVYGRVIA
jgi:hypothetical protein